MEDLFLGIDVGTTAVKLGVIEAGQLRHHGQAALVTYSDYGIDRYQKAAEVLAAVKELIGLIPETFRSRITDIAFSTAMHSLLPQPPEMPLTAGKIFLWSDRQAGPFMEEFRKTQQAQDFYLATGTPIHAMSTFAKIDFLQKTGAYPQETRWLGVKELLLATFTGETVIDAATASATGLYQLASGSWDEKILTFLGIKNPQLARIVDGSKAFTITADLATELGLPLTSNVYAGASDGCLAAFAGYHYTGISNSLTIGTSAAVRVLRKEPKLDPVRQNFCYVLNKDWFVTGAPSNNGGCVLQWAANVFFPQAPQRFYQELPEILAQTAVGSDGVRFAPFINGERAPYWSTAVTAGFQGLTVDTKQAQLIRSVVEGLLLNVKILAEMAGVTDEITLSGGFFQTTALTQLTLDILGCQGVLSEENEPIFGLYAWLKEKPTSPKNSGTELSWNPENYQKYAKLRENYFDFV